MMLTLASFSECYQAIDELHIPRSETHPLWQTQVFKHLSCAAAWSQYQQIIAQQPNHNWYRDHTGTIDVLFGIEQWQAHVGAIDRSYCYLRDNGVILKDAALNHSCLLRLDQNSEAQFARGKGALCGFVRIDYGSRNDCVLKIEDGEDIAVESGDLILVSGYRRHRLTGCGYFVHFQLELPHVARTRVLKNPLFHRNDVCDVLAFGAAVALPMSETLVDFDLLQDKLHWMDRKQSRHYRNVRCPAVRRFLVDNESPENASIQELDMVRGHGIKPGQPGADSVKVIDDITMLSTLQCQKLREFIDSHITSVAIDSVDDLPEYQVNLSAENLTELIGGQSVDKLLAFPSLLNDGYDASKASKISIFLRLYSSNTRTHLAFHHDLCRYTCVVSLNDSCDFDGGHFVMLYDNQLQRAPWQQGQALMHSGNLVHGVSQVTKGVRYSLVLFINTP